MIEFSYLHGVVYIFENSEAQRVKVGLTSHNITGRLNDVNDMWLERKITCQICGGRLINRRGYIPRHVVCGIGCPGGNALPLEKDISLAESYLEVLKNRIGKLSGSTKGSISKKIKTLEKRIELYRHYDRKVGEWQFSIAFITKDAERVEKLSHTILAEHLDKEAPFGEVFYCSVSEATKAIETALGHLGLLESARIKTQL